MMIIVGHVTPFVEYKGDVVDNARLMRRMARRCRAAGWFSG
jgi:hypothetical protein